MTHNCGGASPVIVLPTDTPKEVTPPPSGFLPVYYARESFLIATWNAEAIQRASRDRQALPYGIFVWLIANSTYVLLTMALASGGRPLKLLPTIVAVIWLLVTAAVLSLAQVGACFLIAKWFMGGEGRFVEILRPLLLGSMTLILLAIPYVGVYIAAIAWICVFAMVFQVVADVDAFSAYVLSIVAFIELQRFLLSPPS